MKKAIFLLLCMVLVLMSACSDARGSEASQPSQSDASGSGSVVGSTDDVIDLSDRLMAACTFRDSMTLLADEVVTNFYEIDPAQIETMIVYKGATGATAEEVALFYLKDEKDVQNVLTACETRVQDLTMQYRDYKPEEMPIIQNAVVESKGKLVLLAVCDGAAQALDLLK